mmetsp:Transcript_2637/g.4257  ORF Transcript_2637/g.4257 Transcript_2637/m.4257 type:complete len:582 (-) Transcript_2637:615-2360(-)
MVDDIGGENANLHVGRVFSRFLFDLNIKSKDGSILWHALLVHDGNLCDITLVNCSNTNRTDRNWGLRLFAQKLQQRLEGSKRRCLHHDTLLVGTQLVLQQSQVGHDLSLNVLFLVLWSDNHDWRTSHDLLQTITNNLHTESSLDLLVMNVLRFDSHFAAWRWREETTNFHNNGSVQSTKDGTVTLFQETIDDENIDRHSKAINSLDFENSCLKIGAPHELPPDLLLGHLTQEQQNVLDTFSRYAGCWNQGDKVGVLPVVVSHLPIKIGVDALLRQLDLGVGSTGTEFLHGTFWLLLQGIANRRVFAGFPGVTSVNLIQCHNERHSTFFQHGQTLNSLLFQTVHEINDKNGNITQRRSTISKVRERLVTWCIDDKHTRHINVEFLRDIELGSLRFERLLFKVRGTNLLRNSSSLTLLHIGFSNLVQQRRLSGIDVTHNDHDRTTQVVTGARSDIQFFLLFAISLSFIALLGNHGLLSVQFAHFGFVFGLFLGFNPIAFRAFQSNFTQFLLFNTLFFFNQVFVIIIVVRHCDFLEPRREIVKLATTIVVIIVAGVPVVSGISIPVITRISRLFCFLIHRRLCF